MDAGKHPDHASVPPKLTDPKLTRFPLNRSFHTAGVDGDGDGVGMRWSCAPVGSRTGDEPENTLMPPGALFAPRAYVDDDRLAYTPTGQFR